MEKAATGTDSAGITEADKITDDRSKNETTELNILADSQNITEMLDNPGTEFLKNESERFHSLFGEWLRLIKEIFGLN